MKGQLEGKVTLVTGGSSGIGRATALAFVREGAAKVIIADVNVKSGDETVQMIKKAGGDALFIKADVSKAAEVEAMVNKAIENSGRLDCAFNNAGIYREKQSSTADCTEEIWDRMINVNLKGVWLCMKYEIPQMLKQGGGVIVNNSSIAGLVGLQGEPAYVASKHGVVGLTKTAALEYAPFDIRINAVCPGSVRAEAKRRGLLARLHPIGRCGTYEEVAEAVVWLCSDAASFVTGHTMVVDGGRIAQ